MKTYEVKNNEKVTIARLIASASMKERSEIQPVSLNETNYNFCSRNGKAFIFYKNNIGEIKMESCLLN